MPQAFLNGKFQVNISNWRAVAKGFKPGIIGTWISDADISLQNQSNADC